MEFKEFKEFTYEECKNLGVNQQNRLVDKSHCRSIRQQMVKYIDIMPPVVINEKTNNIIDGQHRIEAFKYLVENDMIDKNSVIRASGMVLIALSSGYTFIYLWLTIGWIQKYGNFENGFSKCMADLMDAASFFGCTYEELNIYIYVVGFISIISFNSLISYIIGRSIKKKNKYKVCTTTFR